MNRRLIKKWFKYLFRVNAVFFAPLVVLAVGTFAVEAATYPGFMFKITDVKPEFFLMAAVGSYVVLISRKLLVGEEYSPEALLVLRANILALPLGIFLLTSLWKLEAEHFPNYVFSTFHLNLNVLQEVLNFSLFLAVPYTMTHYLNIKPLSLASRQKIMKFKPQTWATILFIISILILAAIRLDIIFIRLGKDVAAIIKSPRASFDERLEYQVGTIYKVYLFVNNHTEKTATIAVAPQEQSGTMGNIGYSRYFLYPRYLIHPEDFTPETMPNVDYYVLNRSSFNNETNQVVIWPPYPIKAESIYIFNEYTHEVEKLETTLYEPTNPIFHDKWGVIKVAKE